MAEQVDAKQLRELGFERQAEVLDEAKALEAKCEMAYALYRYVTPEDIEKFNERLKKETFSTSGTKGGVDYYHNYDKLVFIPVADYDEIPPVHVLDRMKEAKEWGCFDTFTIAKVVGVKEYKDPIVWGKINGVGDLFFISQWDDDVSWEGIMEKIKDKEKK